MRVAERLFKLVAQTGLEPPVFLRSDEEGEEGEPEGGEGEGDHWLLGFSGWDNTLFDSQRNCRNPCAVPGGVGVSVVGLFLGGEAFPRLHYLDESAIASSVPFEQAVAGASGGSLVSSYRVNSFN